MIAPVLETPRLLLRAPVEADFPAYESFYGDAGASHFYNGPLERKAAWQRLAADIGHWVLRGFGIFTIERREDERVLGGCGISHPQGWTSHELTWWLLPEARGGGIATEASDAVLRWAYDVLGWKTVETHMRDENEAARRLAARLGGSVVRRNTFPDGVARDVFALPHPDRRMSGAAA